MYKKSWRILILLPYRIFLCDHGVFGRTQIYLKHNMNGQLNQYRPRNPYTGPLINLAAAAGGAAARQGINYLTNRFNNAPPPVYNNPSPYNFNSMAMALPRGTRRRGRGRARGRGRGRGAGRSQARAVGQPNSGISTAGGGKVTVVDTEVLATPTVKLAVFEFNPANAKLSRLTAHAKMYERYRINYFNISYRSGSSTATEGNLAIALAPGTVNSKATDMDTVLKIRPSMFLPAWKNETINVGKLIDSQRFYHANKTDLDGVSFTLYVIASKENLGKIQVSYSVEFAYPVPF